jgi:hypothetical protein
MQLPVVLSNRARDLKDSRAMLQRQATSSILSLPVMRRHLVNRYGEMS